MIAHRVDDVVHTHLEEARVDPYLLQVCVLWGANEESCVLIILYWVSELNIIKYRANRMIETYASEIIGNAV